MGFEKFTEIYKSSEGTTLRVGKGAKEFTFPLSCKNNKKYRLFTVGETEMYYLWKDEPDYPYVYRQITDALDTDHAIRDRYCLSMSCKRFEDYLKRLYKKIKWTPLMLSYLKMNPVPTDWTMGITVTAKSLQLKKNGFLRMRADVRLKKEGVNHRSVSDPADLSYVIDIPEGTYTGEALTKDITIPDDTANVSVFIEGMGYKGEVYIEQPRLAAGGENLLPAFTETAADKTHMDWKAQYLSRKEWPEFCVRLNGKVIFTSEIFERCHRFSEWELDLPYELLKDENTVSYELISDYRDPLPYTLYEIGVIEQPSAPLSIIAVSEAATCGGNARVLVKTERADMTVTLTCDSDAIDGARQIKLREPGLHGILISCKKPAENAAFRLLFDGGEAAGVIGRIVVRGDDKVITGTGDMVYIHQDEKSMEEYLSWYISNHIGDLITIRPTYRWQGTRCINKKVWRSFRRLMSELEFKYVLMADGRELPGLATQPHKELSGGKCFLGTQLHERDGAQFYWGKYIMNGGTKEQWANMAEFAYLEDPDHVASHFNFANYVYKDGNMYMYADRSENDDYRIEHEKAVRSLAAIRNDRDNRHTGPASTFKYMAEAGYKWLGAETMYQTMEPIMGFLRGTVKHCKMPTFAFITRYSGQPHLMTASRNTAATVSRCTHHICRAHMISTQRRVCGASRSTTQASTALPTPAKTT